MVDESYSVVVGYSFDEKSWQWDIGSTRVTLSCGSIASSLEYANSRYEALRSDNKLQQVIHLSCTRRFRIEDGEWQQAPPLPISILPNKNMIVDANRIDFGKVTIFTDASIGFKIKQKDTIIDYTISRVNGTLTGSTSDGKISAIVEGACEVRDPAARRF